MFNLTSSSSSITATTPSRTEEWCYSNSDGRLVIAQMSNEKAEPQARNQIRDEHMGYETADSNRNTKDCQEWWLAIHPMTWDPIPPQPGTFCPKITIAKIMNFIFLVVLTTPFLFFIIHESIRTEPRRSYSPHWTGELPTRSMICLFLDPRTRTVSCTLSAAGTLSPMPTSRLNSPMSPSMLSVFKSTWEAAVSTNGIRLVVQSISSAW